MFRIATSPRDFAEAYIERFKKYTPKIIFYAPYFRMVDVDKEKVVVKSTAIGKKATYEIYGTIKPIAEKDTLQISVKPDFPMWLFALLSPLAISFYPTMIVRLADTHEVRAEITADREYAIKELQKYAMTSSQLLDPYDFEFDNTGASFEGYLYLTPVGYVSFIQKLSEEEAKFFKFIDKIDDLKETDEYGEDESVYTVYDLMDELLSLGLEDKKY